MRSLIISIILLGHSLLIDTSTDQDQFKREYKEFEECLRAKQMNIHKSLNETQICFQLFALSMDVKNWDPKTIDLHKLFSKFCKANNPSECVKSFRNNIQVCLNDEWKIALDHFIVLIDTTRNFICKDDGKRVSDVFMNPNNKACLLNNTNKLDCEMDIRKNVNPIHFMGTGSESRCKEEEKMKVCMKNHLEEYCDKDLVDLYNDFSSELLRQSPCTSSSSSFNFSATLLVICIFAFLGHFTFF